MEQRDKLLFVLFGRRMAPDVISDPLVTVILDIGAHVPDEVPLEDIADLLQRKLPFAPIDRSEAGSKILE